MTDPGQEAEWTAEDDKQFYEEERAMWALEAAEDDARRAECENRYWDVD